MLKAQKNAMKSCAIKPNLTKSGFGSKPKIFAFSLLNFFAIITFGSTAEACQGDMHSWYEKSPTQFVFHGKDTCEGEQVFSIEHNGYEIPVSLSKDGSYKTLVALIEGRNSVFVKTRNGDFVPILDTEVDLVKAVARAKNQPKLEMIVSEIIANPAKTDLDSLTKTHPQIQDIKFHDADAPSWSRLNDLNFDVTAMVEAEKKAAALNSPKKFFTVEMSWSEPVDLDLHIFEPSFKSSAVINEESTGHIWSKASPTLKKLAYGSFDEFEKVPAGQIRREVYNLESIDGKIPEGAYQLKVDYHDRTIRRNQEPMTCGTGIYATPKATLRIKTAYFDTTREFTVPAIDCGTALVRGKVLATVGTIQLQ